jgi:serine/threonine protein kinase
MSIARFEREVQLTSQLTHPNTIAIYDFGRTPENVFYYAMEYLDGLDLDRLVDLDGPQPPARVVHILRQVCSSLAEAHSKGLIHRDIKPANIILCERGGLCDVVKLVDFGLVKNIESSGDAAVSAANTVTGTPLFMAPEAIRTPDQVDARSDLYAVGVVGYYLVTGQRLFEGESVIEVCSHHLQTPPVRPSERLGKPVPEDLERLILSCLEKEAARRPQDARTLESRLSACECTGSWSGEDARAWWEERGRAASRPSEPTEPAAEEAREAPVAASPLAAAPTVEIDLSKR